MSDFEWIRFYDFAVELNANSCKSGNEEAKARTSISRAYYAAFNKSKKYIIDFKSNELQSFKSKPKNQNLGSHDIYIQFLVEYLKDTSLMTIGSILKDLQIMRVEADYYSDKDIRNDTVNDALIASEDIFNEFKQLGYV